MAQARGPGAPFLASSFFSSSCGAPGRGRKRASCLVVAPGVGPRGLGTLHGRTGIDVIDARPQVGR